MNLDAKSWRWIGALVLLVLIVCVFWEALTSSDPLAGGDLSIPSPHAVRLDPVSDFTGYWRATLLGQPIGPTNLLPRRALKVVLSPEAYQVWAFIADVALLYLAMFYFLRGKHMPRGSALAGALAMAFAAKSFSMISPGHLGKFGMYPFAVFTFGLLDRAIVRGSMFHFAAAGVAAGIGLAEHQDVMLMFGLLAAAYGLFLWIVHFDRERALPYVARGVGGAVLAGVLFAGVTLPTFINAFQTTIRDRATLTGSDPQQQWEFATSWSMPPEETLEFVAPGLYGIETGDPRGPYWGRWGRSWHWEETKQGYPNFRLNACYLGVLQLVFAAYAVAWAMRQRGSRKRSGNAAGHGQAGDGADPARGRSDEQHVAELTAASTGIETVGSKPSTQRAEVFFWSAAWLICLLLAMGRYTPLYQLFYSIPYMSAVRVPSKFLHLVDMITVILFAYGLTFFLRDIGAQRDGTKKRKKRDKQARSGLMLGFVIGCGVLAAVLIVAALWVSAKPASLQHLWEFRGVAAGADLHASNMAGALFHGVVVFIIAGGVIACGRQWGAQPRVAGILLAIVLAVVSLDLASVGRKYVKTRQLSAFVIDGPVVDRLRAETAPFRVMAPIMDGLCQRLIMNTFPYYGFDTIRMHGISTLAPDYAQLFKALPLEGYRLWQLANVKYLVGPLGPQSPFTKLAQHPAFELAATVAPMRTPDGGIQLVEAPQPRATHALLLNKSALPRAFLYHTWQSMDDEEALRQLADPSWDVLSQAIVSSDIEPRASETGAEFVEITRYKPMRVVVQTTSSEDGLLVLNDRFDPNWKVHVDGKEASLLKCNFIMRGVLISSGTHEVDFVYCSPHTRTVALRVAAIIVPLVWWLIRLGRRIRGGSKREASND